MADGELNPTNTAQDKTHLWKPRNEQQRQQEEQGGVVRCRGLAEQSISLRPLRAQLSREDG